MPVSLHPEPVSVRTATQGQGGARYSPLDVSVSVPDTTTNVLLLHAARANGLRQPTVLLWKLRTEAAAEARQPPFPRPVPCPAPQGRASSEIGSVGRGDFRGRNHLITIRLLDCFPLEGAVPAHVSTALASFEVREGGEHCVAGSGINVRLRSGHASGLVQRGGGGRDVGT